MRLFLFLPPFLSMLLVGCSAQKEGMSAAEIASEPSSSLSEAAPFTIVALRVDSDSLVAELRYGGGFRAHEFTLISDGAATKSLPRQQPLRITHNANGDMGKALITARHAFDLKRFQDPTQDVVHLSIVGWTKRIDYTYTP